MKRGVGQKAVLAVFAFAAVVLPPAVFAQNVRALPHRTEAADAPVVFFTADVSAAGLMKVYRALGQEVEGGVGLKVSFGAPNEQVLDARLLTELVEETGATMFDCSGLSGNRWTAAMNMALAKAHGFTEVGVCRMIDADGEIDLPVNGGHLLDYTRTGKGFDDYDTLISVHRFKLHYLQALGGNIKNISLCLGSRSGKCLIHSGGTDPNRYYNTAPDVLAKSFADAAKAALDYKKNWAFVNVLDGLAVADSCRGAKNPGRIGIIASRDVVAIDQCAVDFEIGLADATEAEKSAWETAHQVDVLEYAEQIGVGKRHYRFVSLD